MTPQDYVTLIAAVAAAFCSIIAALKAGGAHAEVKAARADVSALAAGLTAPGATVPGASPAIGINQIMKLLRYLDYINMIDSHWSTISHLQPGETDQIPLIRTMIEGKDISIGPTPVFRGK